MNSSARILSTYDKLIQYNSVVQVTAGTVFWDVFDLGRTADQSIDEDQLYLCLTALRAEIDLVVKNLESLDVPLELINPGFQPMRLIADPRYVVTQWTSIKGNIDNNQCRLALAWGSWILREEIDDNLQSAELEDLKNSLVQLKLSLENTELSSFFSEFIRRQLNTIEQALRLEKIQGSKPLKNALKQIHGDIAIEKTELKNASERATENDKSKFGDMLNVIDKTAKLIDNGEKLGKFARWTGSVATEISTIIQNFS